MYAVNLHLLETYFYFTTCLFSTVYLILTQSIIYTCSTINTVNAIYNQSNA